MQPSGAHRAGSAGPGAAAAQSGFSLVELVVVLAVLALLSVVAAPRFFGNTVFEERAWRDEVIAALRYARTLAVGSGCAVRVILDTGSYSLTQQSAAAGHCNSADTTWPQPVTLSDGQVFAGTAPAGVSAAPAATIIFDAAGQTSLAGDQVITIGSVSFTVHAGSGFVSQ